MRAICILDWGQFETYKKYKYYQNKNNKYYVVGDYGDTEFTKKQFDAIFKPEKNTNQIKSLPHK